VSAFARRPLLFAHRGSNVLAPENTIPAFAHALTDGATALEMDVHRTRDGVVVVAHDDDGVRMGGVAKAIASCDWSDVSTWDMGASFTARDGGRPFAGRSLRMPTLAEVLSSFPGIAINVDVKALGVVADVVAVVAAAQASDRVLLTSFDVDNVRAIRAIHSGPVGLTGHEIGMLRFLPLAALRRSWLPSLSGRGRAQLPTTRLVFSLDKTALIERAHALGLSVDYWVINDIATGRHLLDIGADGIMTDQPNTLAPLFGKKP
jgi:glycerophosphoryl diester phosphodiesterase